MANYSEDLRKIMNSLTESAEPRILEVLSEDIPNDLKAFFGSKQAKGVQARQALAKRLEDEWKTYLGRTGRKGNLQDMERFLSKRVGFDNEDLEKVLGPALKNARDANGETKPEDKKDDEQKPNGPATAAAGSGGEPEEKEEAGLTNPDGTPNMKAVRGKLSTMQPGEKLKVAGKTYFVGNPDAGNQHGLKTEPEITTRPDSEDEDDDVQESIDALINEGLLLEFGINDPLSKSGVNKILDKAAAYTFDTYMLNPSKQAGGEGGEEDGPGRSGSARSTKAAKMGNINLDRMWQVVEREGLNDDDVDALKQVVASTRTMRSIKDANDIKMLAAIGYGFLKARRS